MTNYNERLDEVLASHGAEEGEFTESLKQAITSLTKELVAEARIDELTLLADFQMGDITVMGRNERSWRHRISELEQNVTNLTTQTEMLSEM